MVKNKSLFISKNKNEIPQFVEFCTQNKIDLFAESLIYFREVESNEKITCENIFFGSKNAFDYFIKQFEIPNSTIICCVGESTKIHIENQGYKLSFFGEEAGDVENVSKKLNQFIAGKSISFVQSTASKKTIQKYIQSNKIQEIIVYDTILLEKQFSQNFDYLAFTSPSNVEAFLKRNQIPSTSKLISWGKTTDKALNKMGFKSDYIMKTSKIEELINLLKKI